MLHTFNAREMINLQSETNYAFHTSVAEDEFPGARFLRTFSDYRRESAADRQSGGFSRRTRFSGAHSAGLCAHQARHGRLSLYEYRFSCAHHGRSASLSGLGRGMPGAALQSQKHALRADQSIGFLFTANTATAPFHLAGSDFVSAQASAFSCSPVCGAGSSPLRQTRWPSPAPSGCKSFFWSWKTKKIWQPVCLLCWNTPANLRNTSADPSKNIFLRVPPVT